jgi:hypothetical protein
MNGPNTRTATAIAAGVDHPHSYRRWKKMKAANIPMEPWAKLNTPEVL